MEFSLFFWAVITILAALIGALIPRIITSLKRKKTKPYRQIPFPKDHFSEPSVIGPPEEPPEGPIVESRDYEIPSRGPVPLPVILTGQQKENYEEALMLKEDGVYDKALKKLDELLSVRPDYVKAYILKGRIHLDNLKQYQMALDAFKRGIDKDPENKYLLYNLGLVYYYIGDLRQAIYWNQKALEQDPDLIIAIYNHAIYHVDYGKRYNNYGYYLRAIDLYKDIIARNQEFVARSMFNLSALYVRLSRLDKNKAERDQDVKKAIELLDTVIQQEGIERLKKVTGEIAEPYGEDLRTIYQQPDYKRMILKWKNHFTK